MQLLCTGHASYVGPSASQKHMVNTGRTCQHSRRARVLIAAMPWTDSGPDRLSIRKWVYLNAVSLSVTLFGLKINSIVKAISPGVECSLYVDDFLICYRSKHIHIIERHLQQCLNKLADWADTNGFKFSPSKTVCIHFCKLRKSHPESNLLLFPRGSKFVPLNSWGRGSY